MKINEVKKLYHGTNKEFETIDLSFAKGFKDFGKGFYLTSSFSQAQKWAQKKGNREEKAYIYCYDVKITKNTDVKILELLSYDKEWVDFIAKSRMDGYETDYDIIYDRIADNQYQDISEALMKYADNEITVDEVIEKIKWSNPKADQFCFKSQKALEYLEETTVIIQQKNEFGIWENDYLRK